MLKKATLNNIETNKEEPHFLTEDPLEDVFEIIDDPNAKHKKSMFPYEPPQLQTADEIKTWQQLVDDDFIEL